MTTEQLAMARCTGPLLHHRTSWPDSLADSLDTVLPVGAPNRARSHSLRSHRSQSLVTDTGSGQTSGRLESASPTNSGRPIADLTRPHNEDEMREE